MDTPQPLAFSTLLRRYRLDRGLTQEELASRAGIGVRSLSDMERGGRHTPRRDSVERLAEALVLAPAERAGFAEAARRLSVTSLALPLGGVSSAPPFVGRSREVALLERHLSGEGPPVLLLAGEPGIGKTRLLRVAAPRAIGYGLCVLEGGCQRGGGHEPYAPLLGALRGHIRRQRPQDLPAMLRGCAWLARLLPELLDSRLEPLSVGTLPPQQEQRLMVEAILRFLGNVAGPTGALLVLDDLQWASPDALDLLATLTRHATEVSLRMVCAYRDTEIRSHNPLSAMLADLAQAGLATRRLLAPLSVVEAGQLLDHLLEGVKEAEELRAGVLQRAGGVPFFLVSCAQSARLDEDGGQGADAIPWTVAQGLRQRLAVLPEEAREIIGIAAVAGRTVPRFLLQSLASCPEPQLLAGLEAACQARLLEEDGEHSYRFPHDLIRETVEVGLGAARRTVLHRQIAEALERRAGDPPVQALAYHYSHAGEDASAARWLERAGDQATAGFANATALEHYMAARVHRAAAAVDTAGLARLDEKLGDLRMLLGVYEQAREDFGQARLRTLDPVHRAELWRKEGLTWDKRGEFARALEAFDAAEHEVLHAEALPAAVRGAVELSRSEVYLRQGQPDAAVEAIEQAIAHLLAAEHGPATDLATIRAYNHAGRLAFVRDDIQGADAYHRRALALAEQIGDHWGIAQCWSDLGYDANRRGDQDTADDYYQRSLDLFERIGDQEHIASVWLRLGGVAEHRGNLARADECYRRSLVVQERIGDPWGSANSWFSCGRVALLRGDLQAAEDCDRHALALFERIGDAVFLAAAWQALGSVACERGDLRTAATWCRRARRMAGENDAPELAAVAAVSQARVHLRAAAVATSPQTRLRAASALVAFGRRIATEYASARPLIWAVLLTAELRIQQGFLAEAQEEAEEAVRLAVGGALRREEALARRVLGQCALTRGAMNDATDHLRASAAALDDMGAALEAARSQLALALVAASTTEARALLDAARASFATSGATWDLAQADRLAATLFP